MADIAATDPTSIFSDPATKRLKDVWSRSGSKYRIRAVVLLGVNVLLFCGVGMFAYWIRSGEFLALSREGYSDILVATFTGVGEASVSLGSLLAGPVSVENVPMMIPIVGLLMAALIAIPILVAILYRFWYSLPFILVVAFLAVMPWLAITLLGSCVLASVRPFRTRFRFISALIGLIPAIVYLILAWNGTHETIVGKIDPVDGIKYVAPWVMAIVAAACVFAIVLTIADFVDYRPGAVTPLLAIMFGLPVAMFEYRVGRDELYFRLLEQLDRSYFADVDATLSWEQAARRRWEMHPLPRPSWESVRQVEAEKWQMELASDITPYESELVRHQVEIASRCDWFHRQFPDSKYMSGALFIKARALDRRVDMIEFRRTKWIRFYDDFPSAASYQSWRTILHNKPDTILGDLARLRLAQLEAREGQVERAVGRLTEVISRQDFRPKDKIAGQFEFEPTSMTDGAEGIDLPRADLELLSERCVLEARRLYDLLRNNRDPLYDYSPLTGPRSVGEGIWFGLLDLDPRHENYVLNLRRLSAVYPGSQIEDNIQLEIAKSTGDPIERIALLEDLVERFSSRDALPEALFRLSLAYREAGESKEGERIVARLSKIYPSSVWTKQATRLAPLSSHPQITSKGLRNGTTP